MNKYTITIRENDPLDGELLEVIEFEAHCLSRKWIKILLLAVDKGPRRDIRATIERNGEYIGSASSYYDTAFRMTALHLNGRHYIKITDKEVLRNA